MTQPSSPAAQPRLADLALKKPLKVRDIWALGVGVVITGEYFGWNFALKDNGPVAVLLASLIVCLLYLTWVLVLTELSVAMPFAGGPRLRAARPEGRRWDSLWVGRCFCNASSRRSRPPWRRAGLLPFWPILLLPAKRSQFGPHWQLSEFFRAA